MDLDDYFARIGWDGSRTPSDDVLAAIYAHHIRGIPFENIDVLLGRPVRLDPGSLEAKLVRACRGGYCYEHATLFAAVLGELGVAARTHSARVVMVTPRAQAPRTHMFLTVGERVLDPGFGGHAPLVPVPLDGTPAGTHRIAREGAEIALELAREDGSWQRLWVSSLEHDQPIDFEMANHFTSTHASSPFVQRLMARAYGPAGKVSVMNRDVTIVSGDTTRTFQLADRMALRELFARDLGLDVPELASVRVPSVPEWS